ncbi:MAG: ABC transporter substrate-binding protein, partial [Candidatus Dormibacteria bacterium]
MPAGIIAFFVGMLVIEIVAIAKRWDGLAREISFLVAFPAVPLAIRTAFPHTAHHIRTALTVLGCGCALVAAIFLVRIAWLSRQEPVIRIGVSLPFSNDPDDAGPIYTGIQTAMNNAIKDMTGPGIHHIDKHAIEIDHHRVELVAFDDSLIGDSDCRGGRSCPITLRNGGRQRDFTDITRDPRVVGIIGPFNSSVAVREIPAVRAAHIPLLSPANAADCLTSASFADGDCNVARLGQDYYFRLPSPDRVRQKAMANFLWGFWQSKHPAGPPARVAIFEESGPRGVTFSRGAGARFTEAWMKHPSALMPDVHPLADASANEDLRDTLKNLTVKPDIIAYAGTGHGGPLLYQAAAEERWSDTIFAGPGSFENDRYAKTYTDHPSGGPLYAV